MKSLKLCLALYVFILFGCVPIAPQPVSPEPTPRPNNLLTVSSNCQLPEDLQKVFNQNSQSSASQLAKAINALVNASELIRSAFVVGNSENLQVPMVITNWEGASFPRGIFIAWKPSNHATWLTQVICHPDLSFVSARMAQNGNKVEMAVIENWCNASSMGRCYAVHLYRYAADEWEEVWWSRNDKEWPYSHTTADFGDTGIDTILVKSSSWIIDNGPKFLRDGKREIFGEANPDPHRWFFDRWQRQGDSYQLTERKTKPSPYNTLIEFLYALRNQQDANAWVTSQQVTDQALALQIEQRDGFSIYPDEFWRNRSWQMPARIDTESSTNFLYFVHKNDQFLIDRIASFPLTLVSLQQFQPFSLDAFIPSPDGNWVTIANPADESLSLTNPAGDIYPLFPISSTIGQMLWSPNGQSLLVEKNNWRRTDAESEATFMGTPEIWQVKIEEGKPSEPRLLFSAPITSTMLHPTSFDFSDWSPDGRSLLFWTYDLSASAQADGLPAYVLDSQNGTVAQISPEMLTNPSYHSWSPDSSQLAFVDGGYRSAMVHKWLNLYDTHDQQITTLISSTDYIPGDVAWSPTGDTLAIAAVASRNTGPEWADYTSLDDNPAIANRRIYLFDLAKQSLRPLNDAAQFQDAPHWSNDGHTLYYVQRNDDSIALAAADPSTGQWHLMGPTQGLQMINLYYGQFYWERLFEYVPYLLQ